jgi:hypothetical protein
MVLSKVIEDAIEEEITKRVHEKMTQFLEVISRNYSIRYQRLLSDLASMDSSPTVSSPQKGMCCGTVKSGKRCQRPGKYGGYCKMHENQKPDVRSVVETTKKEHTHTLPPLFKAGCPACEESRNCVKVMGL